MMHVAWGTLQKPWDSTRTDAGVKHQLVLSAYPQRGPGSCCGVVSGRRGAVPLHSMSPRHPLGTFDTLGTPAVATRELSITKTFQKHQLVLNPGRG